LSPQLDFVFATGFHSKGNELILKSKHDERLELGRGAGLGVSKGVENRRRSPALRAASPKIAARPFQGWPPTVHRRVGHGRPLAIIQGVHGNLLSYAHGPGINEWPRTIYGEREWLEARKSELEE
jgi:hypothetical protein